jgi:hypothetical protein
MQNGTHLVDRKVDISHGVFALNETMPVAVSRDPTREFFQQGAAGTI